MINSGSDWQEWAVPCLAVEVFCFERFLKSNVKRKSILSKFEFFHKCIFV